MKLNHQQIIDLDNENLPEIDELLARLEGEGDCKQSESHPSDNQHSIHPPYCQKNPKAVLPIHINIQRI